MGNDTHREDLALIREPLQAVKASGIAVELYVIGGQPQPEDWYQDVVVPEQARNYPQFVGWFRQIASQMDLGISPLVDSEFNRSKSGLKFLEYAAAGLSGLFSDVEPYRPLINQSGYGGLVENTTDAWESALRRAVQCVSDVKDDGRNVKEWVQRNHCVEDHIDQFDQHVLSLIGSRVAAD
jgi:hypothetical protein